MYNKLPTLTIGLARRDASGINFKALSVCMQNMTSVFVLRLAVL